MPCHIFGMDERQICFVEQRRGLDTVSNPLSCHAPSRDLMKFPLFERNQSAEGGLVALTSFQKQCGWRAWRRQECCHSRRFSAGAPVPGPFPLYKQEVVVDVPGTSACVQPTVAYPRQS